MHEDIEYDMQAQVQAFLERGFSNHSSSIREFLQKLSSQKLSSLSKEQQVQILAFFMQNSSYFLNLELDCILEDYLLDYTLQNAEVSSIGVRLAQRALRDLRATALTPRCDDSCGFNFLVAQERLADLYSLALVASKFMSKSIGSHIEALHHAGCLKQVHVPDLIAEQQRRIRDASFGDIIFDIPVPESPAPSSQQRKDVISDLNARDSSLFELLLAEAQAINTVISTNSRASLGGNQKQMKAAVSLVTGFIRKLSVELFTYGPLPVLPRKRSRPEADTKPALLHKVAEELLNAAKIYAYLELRKTQEEFLCAVADELIESTSDSLCVACFCTTCLLPIVRALKLPASRVLLKTVSLLCEKFPVVGISCLLVPSLLEIKYPDVLLECYPIHCESNRSLRFELTQRLVRQTNHKGFACNLIRQLICPTDLSVFERLGNEPNLDVIRKTSLIDAFTVSYLRCKAKDAAQVLWVEGVIRFPASTTPGNISLADEGSIDAIFYEMRYEGIVFERESIKAINTVLEFGPWLDDAAVEGIILGMSRSVASSQDNTVLLTVGTIMHKLIKKYPSEITACGREARLLLESVASTSTTSSVLTKAALVSLDQILSNNL